MSHGKRVAPKVNVDQVGFSPQGLGGGFETSETSNGVRRAQGKSEVREDSERNNFGNSEEKGKKGLEKGADLGIGAPFLRSRKGAKKRVPERNNWRKRMAPPLLQSNPNIKRRPKGGRSRKI
ncbi:hypothetical protein TNIN_487931 [Trichonephila inaurata madagascariensis]|uniref:Uncharacterized protein n=1 Tax=Trichonephila inaurata madagascariensis TaxID=2747483 RepID=A0A8X6YSJ3_9ARAC|nr:hypothetical protein TNIN_487931 [Trichonephila inaurata madagascariensis]